VGGFVNDAEKCAVAADHAAGIATFQKSSRQRELIGMGDPDTAGLSDCHQRPAQFTGAAFLCVDHKCESVDGLHGGGRVEKTTQVKVHGPAEGSSFSQAEQKFQVAVGSGEW